jgi:hypothetical protein
MEDWLWQRLALGSGNAGSSLRKEQLKFLRGPRKAVVQELIKLLSFSCKNLEKS